MTRRKRIFLGSAEDFLPMSGFWGRSRAIPPFSIGKERPAIEGRKRVS
jgi:hypothetical protein